MEKLYARAGNCDLAVVLADDLSSQYALAALLHPFPICDRNHDGWVGGA